MLALTLMALWLNEGMAVNMERRLTGHTSTLYTPQEMHAKHLEFWGVAEIQEFWQGKSFNRMDDGNMLSYDLARILVENFGRNWPAFKRFALSAHYDDGGYASARQHLGIELGAAAAALFDKPDADPSDWTLRPELWNMDATPTRSPDSDTKVPE